MPRRPHALLPDAERRPREPRRSVPRPLAVLLVAVGVGVALALLTDTAPGRIVALAALGGALYAVHLVARALWERPPRREREPDTGPPAPADRLLGLPLGVGGAQVLALVVAVGVVVLLQRSTASPLAIAGVALGALGLVGVLALRRMLGM
ncbi:MAG: hypothetical protein IPM29_23895 [Planctomycetes bacterium]|nr:hypothetical protein [Planctomycetota bacterium]